MYYVTVMQHRKPRQLSWEDVIMDKYPLSDFANESSNSTATVTRKYETISDDVIRKVNVEGMIRWLKTFNKDNEELRKADKRILFNTFKIPKNSGGFRDINEPVEPLKTQLYRLLSFMKEDCGLLYHTSAFAYISGRSIYDNNAKHQKNESMWYLKTDFSGFFPHSSLKFVMKMLSMVFPMSEVCKDKEGYAELKKALSLNYLANGEMPQGSPLSPFLTNVIMIPIDHSIFNELAKRKIVYTRYADDMHISAVEKFPWKEIVKLIENTLKEFEAPYTIKPEKTHFGSRKGTNWCLGLMINKDNQITVGWKKKKFFKAALCSFILDTKNGKHWELSDVQHLRGQLSYYTMIEKEYFEEIINQQNKKWDVDVKAMFKQYLNGTI